MANLIEPGGPREVRLRQRQTLREIREEGLTLDMQQYVTDQKDKNFTRAVLAALQCKIHDAHAAKEAALCDARQSKHAAQEASASAEQRAAELQKQVEDETARFLSMQEQQSITQAEAVAAAHGGVGALDLQILQRQLDEKTTECKSLEGSLAEALRQAICASNDAEMWQGAYVQTVEADLERQNGELLQENKQLKEQLKQAVAAAERADERSVAEAHTRRNAERVYDRQLKQKRQKYDERAQKAKKAQEEAERRSERAETRASDSAAECARVKHELLTLQAQLEERRQAESVHAVALPAGQEVTYTINTAAAASEPQPAEAVPSCGNVATTLEVSAAPAAAAVEHITDATALLAGEPIASPMVLDGMDVPLRSPGSLAFTPMASGGPAAPVREDAASPSTSMAGFGSPITSPTSPTAAATTAAVPAAAVLGNEKTELADPDSTLPEEPSTRLHVMAPAGPQESAMPALRSADVSPFGGTDPDPGTPGPAAVTAASPAVGVDPVGPSADPGDQHAAPPADPPVGVEASFGSPMALVAPTTAAAATDGITFTTPAVGPGFGMLGVSNQSHDEGQMPSEASSKAQGETQDIWLPVLTPPSSMPPQGSQDMAPAQKDLAPAVAQAAPTPVVAINGSHAQDRAARRQPITFDLGSWSLPQPGAGFVTPSLRGAVAQGNYKTPPSGEWVTYDNPASSDRAQQVQAAKRLLQGADAEAARVSERANGAALDVVSPRGEGQILQDTPDSLNMVYDNTLFQSEAQAAKRVLPGADVEAASVPEEANGSALGGLSPWGGGNTPQNTPDFLAMLHEYELFEPEACTQALEQPHVSRSGQDLGVLSMMSLDSVAHQASPAGTPGDGMGFSTPAASSGHGVHGGSIQNHEEGHMPIGISQGSDVLMTPDLWLPAMTPPSMVHSQGSQDMALVLQDQDPVNAQAAGTPRTASPAGAEASSIPMASFGPAAAPAASSAASLAAGPAAAPTGVASAEAAEEFAIPSAASLADAGLSASLVPPSAAAAGTAGQGMSLDGAARQLSPAGGDNAFNTPAAGVSPGHGHMLISTHGGGHMPTGMSPGYVMRTPDFCLPVLTPLPSPLHLQNRQRFVPDPDSAVAQPASSPGAASPATAGASLIPMPLPQPTVQAPAVSSATSTTAAGSPADPIAAATACTAVTSVEAAEVSMAPAQTPAGAIVASSAAAAVMPPSAAPAMAVGHGPSTDVPLFCGAQKRAAFAFAQQATGECLSPTQLQCFKRQRQTPAEDAALSGNAAAPQPAAAMQTTLLGKPTGPKFFTMGVNQPNKRGADQAGKKGKPARKAAASMQSTASASKPADAAAPSSSSSSLLLQGGGGQSGAAPAGASLLEHTGVAQQAAPAAQRTAQRTAQTLSPLPRPGKHSRSDTTGQADPDGPSSSDEPRLKRPKLSAAEEGGAQQASASEGHSTAGEEEAKGQVADGGEEQGEGAVVDHSKGDAAQAAPALPLGSMLPGAFSFSQGTAQLKAHRSKRDQPNTPKLKKRGGNAAPVTQEPAPSHAAQQGQHHAALSQPDPAPDSAAVANTSHESALPASAESAAAVSAESAALVSAATTSFMGTGPSSARAADLAAVTTAQSASGVVDGAAEEEVREGTGCIPIVDSLPESTLAEGCVQNPAVPGALTDPHAVPGAQSDPQAVHVSGQDSSSTAVPTGGTNAELLSDPTREETDPSRAESARNPGSAVADTILDFEDSQAGHVQDGPASVMEDAAREEAHPIRVGSAERPSSTAAGSSSGNTGGGEGQAHPGSAPANQQEGPCLFPTRRKRTRQLLDQADPDGPSFSDEPRLKRNKSSGAEKEGAQQASAFGGHSTAGEEEAKRQVAGGGEEEGEEAVVGHSQEEGETVPAASALPLGSMPPGGFSFSEGTVWSRAQGRRTDQSKGTKLKKRGGAAAPTTQGTAPSQAAQQGSSQGQHPAAPSWLAHASGPANVATASTPSVPLQPAVILTTDPAVSMVTEPAASMVTEPAASMVTEPAPAPNVEPAAVVDSEPAPPGADLTGDGAAEPACLVAGSAAEEEAQEATGLTPIMNQMVKCTVRQGCEQLLMSPIPLVTNPLVQSASSSHMTEANPEPAAVQASGHHPTSTAPLGADTNAELPSDAAREAGHPSRTESARNPNSAAADTTVETQEGPAPVTHDDAGEEADPRRGGAAGTPSSDAAGSSSDSEGGQAGHVQNGPASVIDGAATEEAHPSSGGSTANPNPAAAVTSSGGGEGQAHSGSAPANEQEGPSLFPSRRKRTRQVLNQGSGHGNRMVERAPKRHKTDYGSPTGQEPCHNT